MIIVDAENHRDLKNIKLSTDLTIIGGGLAGVCTAITAAREGVKVVLIQDRPVLGGNASSEVRLWALGATSHQGNNNRWAREGGVINEIMEENTWRNCEGNPLFFDALLLEKVRLEENITLLLNTAMVSIEKKDEKTIESVRAFSTQDSTLYDISSPYFCDSSGDGILGYLSGGAFRIGAEKADEFNEPFAPDQDYGELLGHTIYFYSKKTDKPVKFVAPEFALKDITKKIPRYNQISAKSTGCALWWLEYGGRMDTIHDTEEIKWELWKVAYGVWDYLKNSGKFPEMENHTLEWMGNIPGKRESRRFEGDYMISQSDIIEQKEHEDAVAMGGWAVDLHPSDGVYSEKSGCTQYHSKGVYQIPYRCLYSRNIDNLFVGGRLISASHIAFGSTRVMMTTAHTGQATGMAAALCVEKKLKVRDALEKDNMHELKTRLLRSGQFIPHHKMTDQGNLLHQAKLEVSSERPLELIEEGEELLAMDRARALIFPAKKGRMPKISFCYQSESMGQVELQLRSSAKVGNFTPDTILSSKLVEIEVGEKQWLECDFDVELDEDQYLFACVMPREGLSLYSSEELLSAVMTVAHIADPKVAKSAIQEAPEGSGFDTFEFWIPERRPGGKLPAVRFNPAIEAFAVEQLLNNYTRPFIQSNTWIADHSDSEPQIVLNWEEQKSISQIVLNFDTDYDHAMESVQFGHFDRAMPFCVKHFQVLNGAGEIIAEDAKNHHARVELNFSEAIQTDQIIIKLISTHGLAAAVNGIYIGGKY
ncbi:FAD-dependent oxidoreductase [Lentisphaera marina]|uniref:FAD-dependent oxidoreductase n=1 Tax=Lentisphaera marina TaxID=1111041 RepID=UPI002366E7EC|nr:FAD-dependent oxidoreductase [Lentisphaera marina]MDD7985249.1 FAD-dependent oxidoreductase [Lentisphaera marina]